jgi:Zn-dependent membrane protease YugP
MTVIIFIIAIAAIIFGPGLWVRRVLERYSVPADRYSGTGAQLARHLLDKHGLTDVVVESTPDGDHYDPEAKAVRLTPDKFDGRSLTAITVAAHEVGHALQDHEGYAPLKIRSQLVRASRNIEKLGAGVLLISPFIGALTRVPGLGVLMFAAGFCTLATSTLVHFATLPTEFNASARSEIVESRSPDLCLSLIDESAQYRALVGNSTTLTSAGVLRMTSFRDSLVRFGRTQTAWAKTVSHHGSTSSTPTG